MTTLDPDDVPLQQIAAVLGISDRQVRSLTTEGVFETVARARYPLAKTVQAYIAYVARGRVATKHAEKRSAIEDERLRRLRIENDREEGNTVPLYEAQAAFNAAMVLIAARMDALPSRHASELAAMSDAGKIRHFLKDVIIGIREDAAAKLERLADRRNRSAAAQAAAKPRARSVGGRKPSSAAR